MTCQVARNNSIFGAIVGTQAVLNELGRQAWEYWQGIPPEHEMSPELAAACRDARQPAATQAVGG